jgi:hypothetical protein
MKGCLLAPFRLFGCLTLILLGLAAWLYRDRLDDWGRQLWNRATHKPAAMVAADGTPTADALASANRKLARLRDRHEAVTLTADETASLLSASLGPYMRGTFDSITVRLVPGRIQVRALANTARLPSGLLGPLGIALRDHERVTAEGPLSVAAPGRGAWRIDALSFRDFPLPSEVLPKLMEKVTGDSSRAVPVPIPPQARTVKVSPDGVTFSPEAT